MDPTAADYSSSFWLIVQNDLLMFHKERMKDGINLMGMLFKVFKEVIIRPWKW